MRFPQEVSYNHLRLRRQFHKEFRRATHARNSGKILSLQIGEPVARRNLLSKALCILKAKRAWFYIQAASTTILLDKDSDPSLPGA